jgi:hypothetical protein
VRHLTLKIIIAVSIAIALVLSGTSASAAGNTSQPGSGHLVEPRATVDGLTAAEVMGEGWYTDLSLPKKINPFFGNGERCVELGQNGDVLMALGFGPVTCSVEQGTAVFVIGATAICTSAEPPPFGAPDAAGQRDCAKALLDPDTQSISLTVDGGSPADLHIPRFLVCSPQRTVNLLKDNLLKVPPQTATFTACGYVAWLKDLPVGRHTLRSLATFSDGSTHLWEPDVVVTNQL